MKFSSMSDKNFCANITMYSDNITAGAAGTQSQLITTVDDMITFLSTLSSKDIQVVNDSVEKLLERYISCDDREEPFGNNVTNVIRDIASPYGVVTKVINKKGFYTDVINAVGVYRADDIFRAYTQTDYGSEIVFLSIYSDINKFRFYGWWAPISCSIALICMALLENDLLPTRFKELIMNAHRIDQEVVPNNIFGVDEARADMLKHDDPPLER